MSLLPGALYAMKAGVLEAVRAEMAGSAAGAPGRACVVPGLEVAWDDCECAGLLTVHHANLYPSDRFPAPKQEQPWIRCEPHMWIVDLRVTAVRCLPDTDNDQPPSCAALEATTQIADADIEAMQRGAECALDGIFHLVLGHIPVGPGGLCVGSELSVLAALPNCATECP